MRPFALALGVACLATAGVGRAEDADDWAWMGATAYAGSLVGGAYGFSSSMSAPPRPGLLGQHAPGRRAGGRGRRLARRRRAGRTARLAAAGGTLGTAVATGLFRIGSSMPGKRNGFLKVGLTTLPAVGAVLGHGLAPRRPGGVSGFEVELPGLSLEWTDADARAGLALLSGRF
ncbi:MAG: hypothetical protein R3F43_03395 [bacterium]